MSDIIPDGAQIGIEDLLARQDEDALISAAIDATEETRRAMQKWPPFNSAHEGYAILLEEVDELKERVWTNQKKRDIAAMRAEAIQVAAMALRFVADVCDSGRGRV